MEKSEFRKKLIELANSLEEEETVDDYSYDKRDFISYIMNLGKAMFHPTPELNEEYSDEILDSVSAYLGHNFADVPYFAVRVQDYCIAIASPQYIPDAKVKIAKFLHIIPEVFTEVSGPMSTVLVIDCEKQYLRKAYLGIGEDEWLL